MAKRVVLAYSGGLDTSVAVRWMIEELGVEVIAVACDVGQGGDWEALQARALGAGAVEAVVVDCREEFARDFVAPGAQGQRPLRGPVPAGLGAVPAGDRQAPGRGGPRRTAPTPSPTAAPARATTRCASRCPPGRWPPTSRCVAPVRELGHDPRGLHRVRRRATTSRSRPPRRSCTRSTTTSGAGPSSAARWRTRGPARPRASGR